MNKILVGVITNQCKDYVWEPFAKQLKGLQIQGHDVLIVDNSASLRPRKGFNTIHYPNYTETMTEVYKANMSREEDKKINGLTIVTLDCMNILRNAFLKGDYTHLFILESDVFIEKDTVDRLLDMDCDVANFTYLMNMNAYEDLTLCVQSTKDKIGKMIDVEASRELINSGVIELGKTMLGDRMITGCGYGCTMVRREVIEKIPFRLNRTPDGRLTFPDSAFHIDVINNGFVDKIDTDWLPRHENLNNQTMDMIKLLNVQKNTTRRQRRARR